MDPFQLPDKGWGVDKRLRHTLPAGLNGEPVEGVAPRHSPQTKRSTRSSVRRIVNCHSRLHIEGDGWPTCVQPGDTSSDSSSDSRPPISPATPLGDSHKQPDATWPRDFSSFQARRSSWAAVAPGTASGLRLLKVAAPRTRYPDRPGEMCSVGALSRCASRPYRSGAVIAMVGHSRSLARAPVTGIDRFVGHEHGVTRFRQTWRRPGLNPQRRRGGE